MKVGGGCMGMEGVRRGMAGKDTFKVQYACVCA